jgi:hypothetical protein
MTGGGSAYNDDTKTCIKTLHERCHVNSVCTHAHIQLSSHKQSSHLKAIYTILILLWLAAYITSSTTNVICHYSRSYYIWDVWVRRQMHTGFCC